MKNIHIIPTNKPSRLVLDDTTQHLMLINKGDALWGNQNIHITSDEEIKEGNWCYNSINNNVYKKEIDKLSFAYEYKIILTTDQDLIKDGVQKIDDEFLQWFVKNPSCEEVAVGIWSNLAKDGYLYHIIIPKEEQKQHLIDIMRGDENFKKVIKPKQIKCYCGHTTYCDCGPLEEPKQETLEESFSNYVNEKYHFPTQSSTPDLESAKFGAKWQQERMYSEEEVLAFGQFCIGKVADFLNGKGDQTDGQEHSMEELFEQFKKK